MGGACQSAPPKLIHPLGAASGGTGRLRRPRATPAHLRPPQEGPLKDPREGRKKDPFDNRIERKDPNHGRLAGDQIRGGMILAKPWRHPGV
jgi:hypothetical protein